MLFIQNVHKLKSFYADILKLDIVEEIKSEWLLLRAGDCNIRLHKMNVQYAKKNKEDSKQTTIM